jgi:hypothetical protein
MSPDPSFSPKSELGQQLLKAGRDDEPPEGSTDRALELVDSAFVAEEPAPAKRRWALWALPAAAGLLGIVLFAWWPTPAAEQPVAEPVVTPSAAAEPTATATASALVATRPLPEASASASATTAVASRPPAGWKPKTASGGKTSSGGKTAGSSPKTPPPPPAKGACGCAADDMMCQMRCGQK